MSHDIDPRLHRLWHDAGDALTPQTQGRLRAARRTALQPPVHTARRASRLRRVGVPVTALAAVCAIALLVPRGEDAPVVPVVATNTPATVDIAPQIASEADVLDVATLEDDPDFYLWLAGDDTPATTREVSDEPI